MIDKENAHTRKGIFMIDASNGFMKDGNKNRLREQDIHKIVDVFNRQTRDRQILTDGRLRRRSRRTNSTSTSRATSTASKPRIFRTLKAICGAAFPMPMSMLCSATGTSARNSRQTLFKANRPGYLDLAVEKAAIKSTIYEHPEFAGFIKA